MPFDPVSLPRDPDRLIEIIMALQDRNAHLEGVVAALKRTVYGPRSEKLLPIRHSCRSISTMWFSMSRPQRQTMTLSARSLPSPAHRDPQRHETSAPCR